jgi:hypothetical protein
MKKTIYSILLIVLAAFGPFLFVYGGYDDSPGAQGLGLLIFILAIIGLRKIRIKAS